MASSLFVYDDDNSRGQLSGMMMSDLDVEVVKVLTIWVSYADFMNRCYLLISSCEIELIAKFETRSFYFGG